MKYSRADSAKSKNLKITRFVCTLMGEEYIYYIFRFFACTMEKFLFCSAGRGFVKRHLKSSPRQNSTRN